MQRGAADKSLFLHEFEGVRCRPDEEASGFQTLAGVSQHHVGLLLALKRVMVNKLAAADVKHLVGVGQLLRQNLLKTRVRVSVNESEPQLTSESQLTSQSLS